MLNMIRKLGALVITNLKGMGRMFLFLIKSFYYVFRPPFKYNVLLRQIRFLGTKSMVVVLLTGSFAGMVIALQLFYSLRKFGSEAMIGPAVALSLIRELGPVLSALMITGRAGSSLTAEIGIMKISEQIDALTAMALNPMNYLIVPNILAGIIVFPLLSAIFDVIGIYGGYFIAVKLLSLSSGTYFSQMENLVGIADITVGLYKSLSFGIIVTWVCCYKGFHTGYGAQGVSKSTTDAVVMSSILILMWDYFLGTVLL